MKNDELVKVKKALVKWRAQKKHKHEKIPDHIWAMVTSLLETHSKQKLGNFFNISPSLFHSKESPKFKISRKITPSAKIKKTTEPFIEIPTSIPPIKEPDCTLEMVLPNGSKIRIFS